jgi:cbb3-type cytochrome oxidase maturation protein
MYFPGWIILVVVSLWVSLIAFLWALQNGQFADQGRARYLPLRDEAPVAPMINPGKWTKEVYALMGIVLMVLGSLLGCICLSLYHSYK